MPLETEPRLFTEGDQISKENSTSSSMSKMVSLKFTASKSLKKRLSVKRGLSELKITIPHGRNMDILDPIGTN